MNELIIKEISQAYNFHFGGKINRLSVAVQLGLPVPNGFALDMNLIKDIILEPDDNRLHRINEITALIINRFSLNESSYLIVRTSSLLEDSMSDSKAGASFSQRCQSNIAELANTINIVIESNLSNYLFDFGLLIQKVPDVLVSGVAFSGYPDSDTNVIEGGFNFGEYVVSGKQIDFRFSLPRKVSQISNDCYNHKIPIRKYQSQDDLKLIIANRVNLLTDIVARNMNFSPDIEWVVDKSGIIYLVQIRPITTLNNILSKEKFFRHYIEIYFAG